LPCAGKKAAAHGHGSRISRCRHGRRPQAQCYLGVCYQNGQALTDSNEASNGFKKSANKRPRRKIISRVVSMPGWGSPQEYGQGQVFPRSLSRRIRGSFNPRRALRNRPGCYPKLRRSRQMVSFRSRQASRRHNCISGFLLRTRARRSSNYPESRGELIARAEQNPPPPNAILALYQNWPWRSTQHLSMRSSGHSRSAPGAKPPAQARCALRHP